jgi:hypothetical protein
MAVIGNMSYDDLEQVKSLMRVDAERYIEKFDLTPDERDRVLQLAGRHIESGEHPYPLTARGYDPYRRQWLASAYLLGASLNKLGFMFNIANQTVSASMNRILPTHIRNTLRLHQDISLEHLSTYHRSYEENKELLARMTPLEAAKWLEANTDLSD